MTKLAALHTLDVTALDLPAFPAVEATVEDAVRAELDEWDHILAARGGHPIRLWFLVGVAAPHHSALRRDAGPRPR